MFTANKDVVYSDTQLRVAFDGDAVIFSDESEQIFKEQGLDRFFEHEQLNENKPLAQVCISLISGLKGVSKRSDDFIPAVFLHFLSVDLFFVKADSPICFLL